MIAQMQHLGALRSPASLFEAPGAPQNFKHGDRSSAKMFNLTGLTGLVIRKLVDFELKLGCGARWNAQYTYLGKRKGSPTHAFEPRGPSLERAVDAVDAVDAVAWIQRTSPLPYS